MTSKLIYGTLTVELEGRIDTTNAADFDKEQFELVEQVELEQQVQLVQLVEQV